MMELQAYEGLIRNHRELARELQVNVAGCTRREREERLVLAAYEAWGRQMGAHLNGQFAIVLADPATGELFCTRDPLGAELLFTCTASDGRVLAATCIADLLGQPGVARELNEELVQIFLFYSYVPGEETLFKGIRKIEPGGWLHVFPNAPASNAPTPNASAGVAPQNGPSPLRPRVETGRYWELVFEPDESKTLDDWADAISEAMDASLRDICDPEDQPESFLSGGVDSSYLLAKSRATRGHCVAYADQQKSEEAEARATAEYLGRDFNGIAVTPEDFFGNVECFLRAYEQPSGDASGLSLFCAAKKLAPTVPLCFSGEGADEFFAGYGLYQNHKRYEGQANPVYVGATQCMRELDVKRYLKRYFPQRQGAELMRERGAAGRAYDTLSWMLYVDLRGYFEGSILFNSTKISRGTGLDIRMPFCDLRIFDIARRMPSRFKLDETGNKLALRRAAARVLPEDVAYRRKLGFPVPIAAWLADPAYNADVVRAFSSETAARFFNTRELNALLGEFTQGRQGTRNLWHRLRFCRGRAALWRRVWTIYIFIKWYELWF